MLKKIPRPLFVVDHFFYPILATIITLLVLARLKADGLSLGDLAALVALGVIFLLVWLLLRPRQTKNLPVNAISFMREIKHSHKHALLAFESEYCPKCMALGGQVMRLEKAQP